MIVNFDATPQTVNVSLDGLSGNVEVATPFNADRTATLPVRLTIPAHQLGVVVKQ